MWERILGSEFSGADTNFSKSDWLRQLVSTPASAPENPLPHPLPHPLPNLIGSDRSHGLEEWNFGQISNFRQQ